MSRQSVENATGSSHQVASSCPNKFYWIENRSEFLAAFLSRHWRIITFLWIPVVFISFVGYSRQKPLWADEIIFRWIVTLPSVQKIWLALNLGLNTDPPLSHLLTHALTLFFGSAPIVLRLTSLAGLCGMLLCLFLTLRLYVSPLYALFGLVLPFSTTMVQYGFEARPYGLLYGCLALAILCWAKLGDESANQAVWNVLLVLALAASLAGHFYSVFALPAFYLAEGVRSLRRHRINWPTVCALLIASASIALYLPIMAHARQYSSAYFGTSQLLSLPILVIANVSFLLSLFFAFLLTVQAHRTLTRQNHLFQIEETPHVAELITLGIGFLLVPVLAWIAGYVVLKAFADRYVLHGFIGIFLLLPPFVARTFKASRRVAVVLLLVYSVPACFYVARGLVRTSYPSDPAIEAFFAAASTNDLAAINAALPKLSGDIVVSDYHVFLQLVNYSPALKDRCIYLWDQQKERTYTGQDGASHWASTAIQLKWIRAQSWNDYSGSHQTFLLLTTPDTEEERGWLRTYLENTGRYGVLVMKAGKFLIISVRPDQSAVARKMQPSSE